MFFEVQHHSLAGLAGMKKPVILHQLKPSLFLKPTSLCVLLTKTLTEAPLIQAHAFPAMLALLRV